MFINIDKLLLNIFDNISGEDFCFLFWEFKGLFSEYVIYLFHFYVLLAPFVLGLGEGWVWLVWKEGYDFLYWNTISNKFQSKHLCNFWNLILLDSSFFEWGLVESFIGGLPDSFSQKKSTCFIRFLLFLRGFILFWSFWGLSLFFRGKWKS